jgi:DNA segregation ATPase FtsK/SpoIIIE, S-DNA-T family
MVLVGYRRDLGQLPLARQQNTTNNDRLILADAGRVRTCIPVWPRAGRPACLCFIRARKADMPQNAMAAPRSSAGMSSSRSGGRGTSASSARPRPSPVVLAIKRVVLLTLVLAWVFALASLIGFDPADPPTHLVWPANEKVTNWCGPVGAWTAYNIFKLLGMGAWAGVGLGGVLLLSSVVAGSIRDALVRGLGLLFVVAAVSGMHALFFPTVGAFPDLPGGTLGVAGHEILHRHFGHVGAGLWIGAMLLVGLVVAADDWLLGAFSWMRTRGVPAAVVAGQAAAPVVGKVAGATGTAAVVVTKGAAKASGGLIAFLAGSLASLFRSSASKKRAKLHDLEDAEEQVLRDQRKRRDKEAKAKKLKAEEIDDLTDPDEASAGVAVEVEAPAKPKRGRKAPPPIDEDDAAAEPEKPGTGLHAAGAGVPTPDEDDDDDAPGAPQVFDKDALREKIAKLPVVFGQNNRDVATDEDLAGIQSPEQLEIEGKQYKFPGLDLLENPEENFNVKLEEYVRDQAAALESAMKQYNIDGEVVGIESGPVITLYDVRLAPGTKVSAVSAVSSDIARALKAVNIRIVANQMGRDTIGVEVPNAQKEKVRLKELMSKTEKFSSMKLPMFMGKDAAGEPLIEDLAKMPHMLIAGTTGSGKSVCMNTIIMSFLYTKKPSELKMVLVDPKMVEMSQFKDIPHLMCPVVTEMGKAAAILEWACTKMDERYELLAEAGCRDIASYNDLSWEELKERLNVKSDEEGSRIPRKLPYMVFIIDELADLMMTAKEVESHIIRIAQKARAVGMHLILATQRPQANVVTGLIKSNMPCRVAFRVNSGMDSRIVLDSKGAELLLGHGDMLFLNPRTNKLSRAQGTLVDDREIRSVVKFMREIATPSFERQLLQLRKPGSDGSGLGGLSDEERVMQSKNNSSASLAAAQEDPLFERAVEIVLESRRGSVSLLQRRLAIGYTRSSRLIDLMGIAGIISDHKGSVARDVLISPEEWAAMKALAEEEARQKGIDWPPKDRQGDLFPTPAQDTAATPDGTAAPAKPASEVTNKPAAGPAATSPMPAKPAAAKVATTPGRSSMDDETEDDSEPLDLDADFDDDDETDDTGADDNDPPFDADEPPEPPSRGRKR